MARDRRWRGAESSAGIASSGSRAPCDTDIAELTGPLDTVEEGGSRLVVPVRGPGQLRLGGHELAGEGLAEDSLGDLRGTRGGRGDALLDGVGEGKEGSG